MTLTASIAGLVVQYSSRRGALGQGRQLAPALPKPQEVLAAAAQQDVAQWPSGAGEGGEVVPAEDADDKSESTVPRHHARLDHVSESKE
mmetsp:Transcript_113453/g.315942  ORF Transcript_113453/g.315942 Transcript_113453/m.315942 type:complete len:89 (-) Transcript_113453:99-365(-)